MKKFIEICGYVVVTMICCKMWWTGTISISNALLYVSTYIPMVVIWIWIVDKLEK